MQGSPIPKLPGATRMFSLQQTKPLKIWKTPAAQLPGACLLPTVSQEEAL